MFGEGKASDGLAQFFERAFSSLPKPFVRKRWALEFEQRMPPDKAIEPDDVSGYSVFGLLAGSQDNLPDQCQFDDLEEGFDHRVVVEVPSLAHRDQDAAFALEGQTIVVGDHPETCPTELSFSTCEPCFITAFPHSFGRLLRSDALTFSCARLHSQVIRSRLISKLGRTHSKVGPSRHHS